MNNQGAKADAGKLPLTLVPLEIIRNIAEIRRYGKNKYGSSENWKTIEPVRYRDAMFRHMLLYLEDPYGVDEESGLPHLWHLACNVAFLCELEKDEFKKPVLDLSKFKVSPETVQKLKEAVDESSPTVVVDADGFDWKQGDYVSPVDHMVQNVAKQRQVADKFKDTNGLVDEF